MVATVTSRTVIHRYRSQYIYVMQQHVTKGRTPATSSGHTFGRRPGSASSISSDGVSSGSIFPVREACSTPRFVPAADSSSPIPLTSTQISFNPITDSVYQHSQRKAAHQEGTEQLLYPDLSNLMGMTEEQNSWCSSVWVNLTQAEMPGEQESRIWGTDEFDEVSAGGGEVTLDCFEKIRVEEVRVEEIRVEEIRLEEIRVTEVAEATGAEAAVLEPSAQEPDTEVASSAISTAESEDEYDGNGFDTLCQDSNVIDTLFQGT